MTEGIVTPIASSTGSTARGSGGRSIGYAEFGDPNGKPVVLFHGFGDSRLTRYPDDALTARLGIRLITFDRPGIGLTDPMKELTILDRTDDVIDLANSLGLQDISLLGWSGGAPYALAAAGCMAGKVKRVAIVSGFGPFERPGFKKLAPREIKRVMTILKVAPWMANVMATESQKGLQGDASAAMEMSRGIGGAADSGVLNMSGVRANVTSGAEEAFRQGPAGVANDMLLLFRFKWGFNPEDVHTPIDLWYGDDDHMTPPDVGRGLASILPQPRLRMVPGAGHLLYLRNWEEILRTLVADEAPATTTTFQAIAPVTPLSPVTETLAAASLSETTPLAEPAHEEAAAEPVTAQGDVLGITPAWAWTQPAAASPASAEAPAEGEPVAYQEELVAPRDEPAFTPRPQVASASGDQLARLRALGFIVDVPEPVVVELDLVEPEAEVAEPEAELAVPEAELAEPEAEAAEAETAPAGVASEAIPEKPELSVVQPETAAEPEAEVARPELKLVKPEAAPARPSLAWQPVRVPGLIIGKPRRVVPVEPDAPAAKPAIEVTPEPAAEATAEVAPAEPELVVAETAAEPAAGEPEVVAAEPDALVIEDQAVVEPEASAAAAEREAEAAVEQEAEVAVVEAEVEPSGEPEPVVELHGARTTTPAIDSAEAQRLRAAGFLVSGPAVDIAPSEAAEASRVRLAEDELARLRAAGFAPAGAEVAAAPAEVSPEPEIPAVEAATAEPEAVEAAAVEVEPVVAESVEAEPVEAEAVEAEAVVVEAVEAAPVVAEADAVVAVEEAPIEDEPAAEAEPVTDETEPIVAEVDSVVEVEEAPSEEEPEPEAEPVIAETEPVLAEAEAVPAEVEAEQVEEDSAAAEEERAPVATELEEEASEAVVLPARASGTAEGLAGVDVAAPQSEPAPAIAASAAHAPVMKAAERSAPHAEAGREQIVETGVGWVETVPMDVEAASPAASHEVEQDVPPEPMAAAVEEPAEQAPVRDETLERLRAAGFLIGEPRR